MYAEKEMKKQSAILLTEYQDFERKNPKSPYVQPASYGWTGKSARKNYENIFKKFDWKSFKFTFSANVKAPPPTTRSTPRGKSKANNKNNTQQGKGDHNSPTLAQSTVNNGTRIEKYLADELLLDDVESSQIVQLVYDACVYDMIRYPFIYSKTPVLQSILSNDTNGNFTRIEKLIVQMLLDACQIQLVPRPLTVASICKYDYNLHQLWDEMGNIDDLIARALLISNDATIDWLTKYLWCFGFVQNIIRSQRYQVTHDTWLELALSALQNHGYKNDTKLRGIWEQNSARMSNKDRFKYVLEEAQISPNYPLVLLRALRYASELVFYFLNCENFEESYSIIMKTLALIYGMGAKMDWTWFIDVISGVSLDAINSQLATAQNITDLLDSFCVIGSAWRALGRLGAFNPMMLLKNHYLAKLWCLFVLGTITTIINKCTELERDYNAINEMFTRLANNDGVYCAIVFVYFMFDSIVFVLNEI